jgi:formylglycine-generating enzyme required for sulfatase activity
MGSKDDNPIAYDAEKPQHTVELPYDYWLARLPVTNDQFAMFVESAPYKFEMANDWKDRINHPVVNVSWYDAVKYCEWLNEKLRGELGELSLRLPTEAEWEKAARGATGNEWSWGDEFDKIKCNSFEGGKGGTTPVDAYSPQGDSPYGVADMVGNVWEWTLSLWGKDGNKPHFKYPYTPKDGREDMKAGNTVLRVARGGSFLQNHRAVRAACRARRNHRHVDLGFRLVVAPRLS